MITTSIFVNLFLWMMSLWCHHFRSVPGELTAPTSTLITEQSHSVPHPSGNNVGTSSQAGGNNITDTMINF